MSLINLMNLIFTELTEVLFNRFNSLIKKICLEALFNKEFWREKCSSIDVTKFQWIRRNEFSTDVIRREKATNINQIRRKEDFLSFWNLCSDFVFVSLSSYLLINTFTFETSLRHWFYVVWRSVNNCFEKNNLTSCSHNFFFNSNINQSSDRSRNFVDDRTRTNKQTNKKKFDRH